MKPLLSLDGYWDQKVRENKISGQKLFRDLKIKSKKDLTEMSKEDLIGEYRRLANIGTKPILAIKARSEKYEQFRKMNPTAALLYLENTSKKELVETVVTPLSGTDALPVSVIDRNLKVTSYKVAGVKRDQEGKMLSAKGIVECPHPEHLRHAAVHNHGLNTGFLDKDLNPLTEEDLHRKQAARAAQREDRRSQWQRKEAGRRQQMRRDLMNRRHDAREEKFQEFRGNYGSNERERDEDEYSERASNRGYDR